MYLSSRSNQPHQVASVLVVKPAAAAMTSRPQHQAPATGDRSYFEQQREALVGDIALVRPLAARRPFPRAAPRRRLKLTAAAELRACARQHQQAEPIARSRRRRASEPASSSLRRDGQRARLTASRSATSSPRSRRCGRSSKASWPRTTRRPRKVSSSSNKVPATTSATTTPKIQRRGPSTTRERVSTRATFYYILLPSLTTRPCHLQLEKDRK